MIKEKVVLRLIWFGIITAMLIGCSAEKELARVLRRHPELALQDTIRDTVEVIVPEIDIETEIDLSDDVSGVDSILSVFGDKIDSLTALKLGTEIKYYISNRNVLAEDTVYYTEDGVSVKVWQQDGRLRFEMNKPAEVIQKPVAIPYQRIVYPESKTEWWKWLLIGFVVYLVFKDLFYARKKWLHPNDSKSSETDTEA